MSNWKPTEEQQEILNEVLNTNSNIVISALAGCGKTSLLIKIMEILPDNGKSLFLAFNKHIKEELDARVPEGIKTSTSHGLGMGALRRKYGNFTVNDFKIDQIIDKESKKWTYDPNMILDEYEYKVEMRKLITMMKTTATIEPKYIGFMIRFYGINLPEDITTIKRAKTILGKSLENREEIDFADMIFLPVYDKSIYVPQYDYVFCDEIQDFNRAQQLLAQRATKFGGRMFLVGDKKQSIYMFNGASPKSFDYFSERPNTKIFPMTVTWRCSKNIVNKANEIVKELKAAPNAADGSVRNGRVIKEAVVGDFVLARKTRPLFVVFFDLLKNGIPAKIIGKDIGESLIKFIGQSKDIKKMLGRLDKQLSKIKTDLIRKGILNYKDHHQYVDFSDKKKALEFVAEQVSDIHEMKSFIKEIFSDKTEGVILSTIHKAKGLEADRVFIVDPDNIRLKTQNKYEAQQEENCEYIAYTRARHELIFDNSYDFDEDDNK